MPEPSERKQVSALGALLIGVVLGGGMVFWFHSRETKLVQDELQKLKGMSEENRQKTMTLRAEVLRLHQEIDKDKMPSSNKGAAETGK